MPDRRPPAPAGPERDPARPWWHALAGAVAAAVALATGELVATADDAGVSLVSAVGDEFIDVVGARLKDVAVSLFGTNDKVALVVGIVVVSTALGAAVGVAGHRRAWIVPVGFGGFAVLGGVAYQRAPLTSAAVGWVAAALAGSAGIAALLVLARLVPVPAPGPVDDGVAATGGVAPAPRSPGPGVGQATRRGFLLTAGSLGMGAAGAALASRRLRGTDPAVAARREIVLPAPSEAAPVPKSPPFDVEGLSPYITPTADFYRIDTALTVPRLDPDRWRLRLSGLVDRPFDIGYQELLDLDSVEAPVTLQCVSNEVGGDLVGNAVWQGVRLADLLDRAGVQADATQVVGRSVDGWTAGFPTDLVGDGRTAIVAYAMIGEPLPSRHGFPARLVVAGLYGYVSATKWLEEIELTRWEDFAGYWVPLGWAKEGPIKIASRIDVPRPGATVREGAAAVAGVAWAPDRGISAVDVRVDDGPWQPCTLGAASDETWVQWHLRWEATPGDHVLSVRAVDGGGEMQTAEVAPPAPDGATGHHTRRVRVESP